MNNVILTKKILCTCPTTVVILSIRSRLNWVELSCTMARRFWSRWMNKQQINGNAGDFRKTTQHWVSKLVTSGNYSEDLKGLSEWISILTSCSTEEKDRRKQWFEILTVLTNEQVVLNISFSSSQVQQPKIMYIHILQLHKNVRRCHDH